ncbi:MAG: Hsp33 family molecular chaperone HslO [Firmicutes bacterium]|nr:Hsp33 family molecular chaperone HslO [Bacillota bacterium]
MGKLGQDNSSGLNEYVAQGTAANGQIRVLAVDNTKIVEEVRRRHQMLPWASAALGRTMAATAMLGAMLKDNDKVTVQIVGDGPLGQIVADGDAQGNLRGYVSNPHAEVPNHSGNKLNVGAAVGEGHLFVIRDIGLGEPYSGSVPLISGEIAEDFANYFARSEQTPSAVALGVLVDVDYSIKASGGLILQLLPDASEGIAIMLEHMLKDLPPISSILADGGTPEDIIEAAVGDLEPKYLHQLPLRFSCTCSRKRGEATLVALGPEELRSLLEDEGQAKLTCHFCQEEYVYDQRDVEAIIHQITAQAGE